MVKNSGCEKSAAAPPMNRYLIPCSCSRRIAVPASRAGGTVRCADCGASVAVPRLGELVRFEAAAPESAAPVGSAWSAARAWLLVGIVVMVAAAAAAGWLRGQRSAVAPLAADAIRAAVAAADVSLVHSSWLEFERQGIERPPVAEEVRRQRQAGGLAALERLAWLVAGLGALVTGLAAILVGVGPRG